MGLSFQRPNSFFNKYNLPKALAIFVHSLSLPKNPKKAKKNFVYFLNFKSWVPMSEEAPYILLPDL